MPSVKNPGLLVPRAGQVPAKTVPSAGLIEPNRDVEPLKAHLRDPNRAHMASAIGVLDAGGFFESDDVEGALQEVGTTGFYVRQSGVVQGCLTSVSGADLEVAASSFVLLRGNVRDVSGLTATIPATAGTYYAYIDSAVTLQINAVLPSITNNDVVILNKVVTDGIGGVVLSDARFFVARLDRKLDLTLRSEAVASDNAAEACFVTTEAALFWLANITQDVKKTLLIRGNLTLTDTLVIPTSGVTIRGEGAASITLDTAVQIAIDLNGQDDAIIENIDFICNSTTGNSIAIYDNDAAGLSNLIVRNCNFYSGATGWSGYAVYLGGSGTGTYSRVSFERCVGAVSGNGVYVYNPTHRLILRDCEFTGTSPVNSGLFCYWIDKDSSSQYMVLTIENCKATNFERGVFSYGATSIGDGTIKNCKFIGVISGVVCSDPFLVLACEIQLNSSFGLYGVLCGEGTVVRDCTIATTRSPATYVSDHAAGVYAYSRCVVDGCYISGFHTTANYRSDGVLILPSTVAQDYNKVVNNHFVNSAVYAFSDPSDPQNGLSVQGNTFVSDTTTSLSYGAISANGQTNFVISNNTIRCNTSANPIGGFSYGVEVKSGQLTYVGFPYDSGYTSNASIKDNVITSPRYSGVYLFGYMSQFSVFGNTIDGLVDANPTAPSAYGVHVAANTTSSTSTPAGIGHEGSISSNRLTRLYSGIYLGGSSTYYTNALTLTNNDISYCAYTNGAAYDALNFTNSGSKGIGVEYATNVVVSNNNVSNIGVVLLDDISTQPPSSSNVASNGIYLYNAYPAQVEGNVVSGLNATSGGQSHGIHAVVISGVGVLGERDIRIANNSLELLQDPLDSGTATAGGAPTLTDASKTWTVNAYTNCIVTITAGTGSGQTKYILTNTATILTVATPWATPPDGTSAYSILQSEVNGTAAIRHTQRQLLGASGFIGLQIEGNHIRTHESTSAQEPFEYGIWLDGDNGALGASYLDTRVCNNMIHGWSGAAQLAGIFIYGDKVSGALNLYGLMVDNNALLSTTTGSVNNAAIYVLAYNGTFSDSSISGNNISGETETLITADAIKINVDGTNVKSLRVDGNVIAANTGVRVDNTNASYALSGLSVSNNRFRGAIATTIDTAGNVYDCKIDGNTGVGIGTSNGLAVGAEVSCLEYYNFSVSNNDFLLSNNLAPATGIEFISTSNYNPGVGIRVLQNLKIDNNQINLLEVNTTVLSGTRGIDVKINEANSGISVCNNDINFYNATNSPTVEAICGIRLYTETTYNSKIWRRTKVCNNSIAGVFTASGLFPEHGALVIDLQPTALTYMSLYNASISGNIATGLPYDQTSGTSHGFYMQINNAAISGYAVSVTNNAFTEFLDTGVGICAQFVGNVPANSICQGNISQDGGAAGFTGFSFSINADNIDY